MGLPFKGFGQDLVEKYRGPNRHFHNQRHIVSVLTRIDSLIPTALRLDPDLDVGTVKIAALYHDAVYVPGFSLNEHLSAVYAEGHLANMFFMTNWIGPHEVIEDVNRLVRATKNHKSDVIADRLLIDADLYELSTGLYHINGSNVWEEFKNAGVSRKDFEVGRTRFLKSFLDRDRIFLLPGQEKEEAAARSNMQKELDGLLND